MPNWCNNMLIITGPEGSLADFARKAKGPDQNYGPQNFELREAARALGIEENLLNDDFHVARIKTMLAGDDPRLDEVRKRWGMDKEPEPDRVLSFHQLFPVPDEVLEAQYDPTGYQWECENWGVKWGCSDPQLLQESGKLQYRFCTPWGPPLPFLKKVSTDFPDLEFNCRWAEPGMAAAGQSSFKNGDETDTEWAMTEEDRGDDFLGTNSFSFY